MSVNKEIAKRLEQMAALLEITGADRFRVNAHARAARVVDDLKEDLGKLVKEDTDLTAIDGIGAKTAGKIVEFVESGAIKEHEELLAKVPNGLLDVLEVPGLGPKTVKLLWENLKVESVSDLKCAIENESILELPRMGKKTVENIKQSIAFQEESGERLPIGIAMPIAEMLIESLRSGVDHIAYAGSLRRGRETIGDIDILAVTKNADALRERFTSLEGVEKVLAAGETKSSIRYRQSESPGKGKVVQIDLRIVPAGSFGAAMHYFTGSKEHNVRLREQAQKKGLTLNEYGLYPADDDDTPPQQRKVKPVAGETEESIFEALGYSYLAPELREDRGEFDEDSGKIKLIEVDDVCAELHAHTTASDGAMSIEELARNAKKRAFHTIAVTDHSKSQPVANGLNEERLLEHIEAVHEVDSKLKGIRVLTGSEVDILANGSLDYSDEILAQLDVVVASPHHALKQKPDVATKRLLKAIENPYVHVLGHPCGRLVNKREGLSPDIEGIATAAAKSGVALEINAHWMRLDLRDTHVRIALDAGANIAINCDVHAPTDFDNLRYGVLTGRRGWLPAERCVNTWPARRLHAWLKDRTQESAS